MNMSKKYKVRKNVMAMSKQERHDFINAVLVLKKKGIYDRYVAWHAAAGKFQTPPHRPAEGGETAGDGHSGSHISPIDDHKNAPHMGHGSGNGNGDGQEAAAAPHRNAAHMGPSFLPWHREFLRLFEEDLQKVNPSVVLPYWDWAADSKRKNPGRSPIWSPSFMGGNGNPDRDFIVEDGPFAAGRWETIDEAGNLAGPLKRSFGESSGAPTLPTRKDVYDALQAVPYDRPPWDMTSEPSFRNLLEGFIDGPQLHNRVHGWVGGHMGNVPTAPNDPVFFLHHANVDRLWAMWQIIHPKRTYLPLKGGPVGHNYHDYMFPWNTSPKDVIDHHKLGYVYDVEIERAKRLSRQQRK